MHRKIGVPSAILAALGCVLASSFMAWGWSEATFVVSATYFIFTIFILCCIALVDFRRVKLASVILIFYLIFAYMLKMAYLLIFKEDVAVLKEVSESELVGVILNGLPRVMIALAALIAVLLLFKKKESLIRVYGRADRYHAMLFVLCFSLSLKYVVHIFLGWGVPGLEPENVVPGLTGVVTLYVRYPLFFILNLFFAIQVLKGARGRVASAIFIIILYVLLDMYNGSKYSLIYESFFMVAFLLYLVREGLVRRRKLLLVLFVVSVTLPLYKYINYLRFATLDGEQLVQALSTAVQNVSEKEISLVGSLIARISGVEHSLFALSRGLVGVDVRLSALFTNELASLYTESVTGVSGIVNAVGASQIALIVSMTSSYLLVAVVSFLYFGFAFFLLRTMMEMALPKEILNNFVLYYVVETLFAIFLVYFLFGTGNFVFYIKEVVVLFLALCAFRALRLY